MFIPYVPANEKSGENRRRINRFVAAHTAKRRHDSNPRKLGRGINIQGLRTDSAQQTNNNTKRQNEKCSNQSQDDGSLAPIPIQTMEIMPLGAGKFYPMSSLGSKGPSTLRALTYYFDVILPHNFHGFGHSTSHANHYASILLSWSSTYDMILHGLAAFGLCNLESQDSSGAIRTATLFHRKRLLDEVQKMLSLQTVDDILISALSLLIPIDDYLGYVDYSKVHLDGLETVIRMRGGYGQVGASFPRISKDVQLGLLTARSLLLFHVQTSIAGNSSHVNNTLRPDVTLLYNPALNLPPGFMDLTRTGHVSHSFIELLLNFLDWLGKYAGIDPSLIPAWRCPASQELNAVEKCLFVGLLCLADDMSSMGLHAAALVLRQPKKRAEMLFSVQALWIDPSLADCLVWLATVISTPRNSRITPYAVQRELYTRIILRRDDMHGWEDVRTVLGRFFYEESLAAVWKVTWESTYSGIYKNPAFVSTLVS